jgi:hypothetical protein
MAELADARDLKSRGLRGSCGFKSHSRHQSLQSLAAQGFFDARNLKIIITDTKPQLIKAIMEMTHDAFFQNRRMNIATGIYEIDDIYIYKRILNNSLCGKGWII